MPTRGGQKSRVELVFSELATFHGARFADFWAGQDFAAVKRSWDARLSEYSDQEVMRGIDACAHRKFLPTLPEFLDLCRPPMNAESAFYEALEQMRLRRECRDTWSNPAIFFAAKTMAFDMQSMTYEHIKTRWVNALKQATQDIRDGNLPREVPGPAVALVAPGETMISKEQAKANIDRIKRDVLKLSQFKCMGE